MEFVLNHFDTIGVAVILLFMGYFENPIGLYGPKRRDSYSNKLEFAGLLAVFLLIKPGIIYSSYSILTAISPGSAGALGEVSFGWAILGYLLIDDVLQYSYHRAAHVWPLLWKLHRAHHSATSMGAFVTYRNGFFYYVFMPNLWWGGAAVWAGLGQVVAVSLVIKLVVVISSHAEKPWDKFFYDRPQLSWVMAIIERIIVTPSTHRGHHGKTIDDGVSNPNGNFGNMFFIWDQIFGTAKINRRYPEVYGIENDKAKDTWQAEFFWPLISSSDPNSELYFQKDNKSIRVP